VTGVILRDKVPGFERLLWRACRGNVFLRHVPVSEELRDPVTDEVLHKEVIIIFFQSDALRNRVTKICDAYSVNLYQCPDKSADRREMILQIDTRITDLQNILNRTDEHRRRVLSNIGYQLAMWQVKVKKVKAIYHVMNKFNVDSARKCLIGELWCPVARMNDIRAVLREASVRAGLTVPAILSPLETHEKPPTYHMCNKFTEGFQAIVDAYGVASYQEVNPGPFTIITFPFLFAVMFGDFGHGLLMAAAAFFLIYKEESLKKWKNGGEMWNTLFGGRYIIFLMGLFSIYTGFFYNDWFSKSVTFGSSGRVAGPR